MNKSDINILSRGADLNLLSILANAEMFYGNPYGSTMDYKSATQANQILGNADEAKLLECSLSGCKLKFNTSTRICITGADMAWSIDEVTVDRYKEIEVIAGQILKGKFARIGLRSYIAFANGALDMDDHSIRISESNGGQGILDETALQINSDLIIHKGPEWNLLSQEGKEKMIQYEAIISKDLSRMGIYLQGKGIPLDNDFPKSSVCTFPGVIQLLPNGQLLVLSQYAQTTGGYPRIAYLDKGNLCDFNQLGIGHTLKWRLIK